MTGNSKNSRRRDITDDMVLDAWRWAQREAPRRPLTAAAERLGIWRSAVSARLETLRQKGFDIHGVRPEAPYQVQAPPLADVPIDELVARRKREFHHRRAHEEAARLIPVKVRLQGPIGILHFGDPHVDDDGTDIEALERHTNLVRRTEGLFAANVGDTTNNWVGRLAKLYADQGTTAAQAWRLAEWFLGRCQWLYMIGGNHDLWSGSGDPLKWIARQQVGVYRSSEVRLALRFPNGLEVRVNARHDHAGSSIWNPAHGPMKAAQLGVRDHMFMAGHKHESAYGVVKDPDSGITMHAIKVASYKVYDRYARERGFRDQALSPGVLTVIDTRLSPKHPDIVKVWWHPEEGADYLKFLRRRKAA